MKKLSKNSINLKKAFLKTIKWGACTLAGCILVVVILFCALQVDYINDWLISVLNRSLYDESNIKLEIKGIKGTVPFHFKIGELNLYDKSGRWLKAQNCSVDIAPLELFEGRLYIKKFYIKKTEIDRFPAKTKNKKKSVLEGFHIPPFISRISVEDIYMPGIDLGGEILGKPAHFTLKGGAANETDEGKKGINLQIERTDGSPGSLMISMSLDNNSGYMSLMISADDPGRGILYHSTGIGEDFKLRVEGEGELSDWHGKLRLYSSDSGQLDADIHIKTARDINLNLDGNFIFEDSPMDENYRTLIGKRTDFKIDADINDNMKIDVNLLRLKAGKNEAEFKGRIGPEDLNSEGNFSLKIDDLVFLEKLSGQHLSGNLSVEGKLRGKLFSPDIDLSYNAEGLSGKLFETSGLKGVAHVSFSHENKSDLSVNILGDGNITEVLVRSGSHVYHENKTHYRFDLTEKSNEDLRINLLDLYSDHFSAVTSGDVNIRQKHASLEGKLDVTDLSRFNPQADYLKAKGDMDFKLDADLKQISINGSVKGACQPAPDNQDLIKLAGDNISLEGNLTFRNDIFRFSDVRVDGRGVSLAGSGTYNLNGAVDSSISLFISDLALIPGQTAGKIKGTGKIDCSLKGNLNRLEISSNADIHDFQWEDIKAGVVKGRITGLHTEKQDRGKISVEFINNHNVVNAGSDFIMSGPEISLNDIHLTGTKTDINGNLDLNIKKPLFNGKMSLSSSDISELTMFFGRRIRGTVSGEFVFEEKQNRQDIQISASAGNVTFKREGIENIHVKGKLSDIFNSPGFSAEASVTGYNFRGLNLKTVNIQGEGTKDSAKFNFKGQGFAGEELTFEASAAFKAADMHKSVDITGMKVRFGTIPVNLIDPLVIIYSPDSTLVKNINIGIDSGSVKGLINYTDETADANLSVKKIPIALLSFAGLPLLEGTLEGDISLEGSPSMPRVSGTLSIEGMKIKNYKKNRIPPVAVKAKYFLGQGRMSGEFSVGGVSSPGLKGNIKVPCNFSIHPFILAPNDKDLLEGSIKGELDLALISPVLEFYDQSFSGKLDTNIEIGGVYSSPTISGKADLSGGSYENAGMGVHLNDVKADLSAGNSAIILRSFSADDGLKGMVKGSGRVDIDTQKNFPYDINMVLNGMQITRSDKLSSVVDGNIAASGSTKEHNITGKLTIERADFRIPEKLPVDITELDIKEINTKSVLSPEETGKSPEKVNVNFDVSVSSSGRVYIRGRGLDSEWKGDLNLKGTSGDPLISGKLTLVRGNYSFLSKQFILTEGAVTFFGHSPPDPSLEVTGKIVNSNITAYINLKGNMKNPVLTLSSEPALPQDEILARVLFGREVSQITPLQALQLAAALKEMLGGKQGFDPLKYTRNLLGVDRLEVIQSQTDSGGSAISAGKYINDNIYLEVEKGIGTGSGKASVTWELTPNITVETDVGENAEKGMGINWKYDY